MWGRLVADVAHALLRAVSRLISTPALLFDTVCESCARTGRREEQRSIPVGNVSGGINLALAPLRHRVFPCKFLMQFGLDVHLVVPRGSWRVSTRHAGVRAPRQRLPGPLWLIQFPRHQQV